jgi:hypothetical protein
MGGIVCGERGSTEMCPGDEWPGEESPAGLLSFRKGRSNIAGIAPADIGAVRLV